MNTFATRIAPLALSLVLACALVPAGAFAKTTDASSTSKAQQAQAAQAAQDATGAQDAAATEGAAGADSAATTQDDAAATAADAKSSKGSKSADKPAKEPVTLVSASIAYRVKTGKTWSDVAQDGAKAGDTDDAATGIQLKKIEVEKSNGKVRSSKDYTLQAYVDGAWKNIKPTKSFTSASKIIQAVKIELGDTLSEDFDIYYRAYSRNFGWLGWAKNGKTAGTLGQGLSLRGLQVKVVKKGKKAPKATSMPARVKGTGVAYSAGLVGNANKLKSTKKNGSTAGKTVYSARIDRIAAKISGGSTSGGIKYRVRTGSNNSSGWTPWKKNGAKAGSKGKTVQAVQVKLTGKAAKYYDVYYRVYSGDRHWLGWAKNGKTAGTGSIGYPVGALQVKLVAKCFGAPGATTGAYTTKGVGLYGHQLNMLRKAQKYYSGTQYLILVDRDWCKTIVFQGSKDNWSLIKYWDCVVGAPGTPTITGQFSSGYHMYSFGEKKGYSCYYATVIHNDYLFHSILYYANTRSVMDGTMGAHASHGCVRLWIQNAKWIYDNVHSGTKVVIF